MAGDGILKLQVPPYPIIESDDPNVWRGIAATRSDQDAMPNAAQKAGSPVTRRLAPSNGWRALPTDVWIGKPPVPSDLPDDVEDEIADGPDEARYVAVLILLGILSLVLSVWAAI